MAERNNEFLYNIPRLNRWFALTSLLLLVSICWLIWDDYSRPWKRYQRQFRDLEYSRTQSRIQEAEGKIDPQKRQDLKNRLEEAQNAARAKEKEIHALQGNLAGIEARSYRATQNSRFTKADLSTQMYRLNEAVRTGNPSRESIAERVRDLRDLLERYNDEVKEIDRERVEVEDQIAVLTGHMKDIQDEMAQTTRQRDLLRKKLQSISYSFANRLRNLPVMDFMNPSLRIQQTVLEDVLLDLTFLRIPRVDRCTTCHLGIDREAYRGEDPPFNAHPHLDLFVASTSPHPKETFGCSGCHQGQDRATSFGLAAHTPSGEHAAKEWKRKYHWHELEHWEYPMLARPHMEAACFQCHSREWEIPGAEKLNRGRHLFQELGCHGCHKVEGFENLPKVGPDLRRIGNKTTREWAFQWIADPKAFRPTTKMPKSFFTTNRNQEEDLAMNHAEVHAIVTYLFAKSQATVYPAVPHGNPERGRSLAHQVGCQGCHLVIDELPEGVDEDHGRFGFGPNLQRIGEKVNAEWLWQWLQNPRKVHPGTRMPDLRLTPQEAADLTTYLMTLRSREKTGPAPIDVEKRKRALNELMLILLRRQLTRDQADEKVKSMSDEEKNLFVGEKLIPRYGCAGCHEIAGFENAQRIGVELTEEGNKIPRKLDFGFLEIDHSLPDWLYQKMRDSRIFDLKRVVSWEDKLRMPDFTLTAGESEALVTLLLSFQKRSMRPRNARKLTSTEEAIEEGRRILILKNCRACHVIEGKGGDIHQAVARGLAAQGVSPEQATAYSPPDLYREGRKVQPDWLFRFLLAPQRIRQWIQVRMPTFHFSDEEATTLARYFSLLDGAEFPFASQRPERMTAEELQAGRTLFHADYLNCFSCHQQGNRKPEGPPSGWAPDFALSRDRLRPAWIADWLRDPQDLQPGTKMPSFFATPDSGPPDILGGDEEKQIDILRKYLLTLGS